MKIIKQSGAQGDVLFIRVDELPDDVTADGQNETVIVAHSETGHHHVIERGAVRYTSPNPLIAYLEVQWEFAELLHKRSSDTHKPFGLANGVWKVVRQREYTPSGLRMVQD